MRHIYKRVGGMDVARSNVLEVFCPRQVLFVKVVKATDSLLDTMRQ